MKNITKELLSEFSIFSGLSLQQISPFVTYIKKHNHEKNETIINEGDDGNSLIFLLSGEVAITKAMTLITNKTNLDNREKEITKLTARDKPVFGEMSLFDDNDKRTATILSLSDCMTGIINSKDFFNICNTDPDIGNIVMKNIAGQLAKNLQKTNMQVLKLTTAFSLILES